MRNYIKELNAFYERVQLVPVSSAASSLWHALMHINNIARWKESFTASAAVLKLKGGLTESSFKRARKELVEKGYITFQSRPHKQAPIYTILSLVYEDEKGVESTVDQWMDYPQDQGVNQLASQPMSQQMAHKTDHSSDHSSNQKPSTLVKHKQDEKKQNETETAEAVAFFEENFGDEISPFVKSAIRDWSENVGDELVIEAMKRALERNKSTWIYVKGILQKWSDKGIRSVEEAQKEVVSHVTNKGSNQTYYSSKSGRGQSQEIVPEWFEEHQRNKRESAKVREADLQRAQKDPELVAEMEAWLEGRRA